MTRDDIIKAALRKLNVLRGGGSPTASQLTNASQALNVLIRQEDAKNTKQSKDLWALSESHLILVANQVMYGTATGLETNIMDIETAHFRDTGGDDRPVDILTKAQYETIANKNDTGDSIAVFLKQDRLLASQVLNIWPTPSGVGVTSEVLGTDALNYSCIMGHTSANLNKPITGADYKLYWRQVGSAGVAWITGTSYTNGELIRYTFKRPLFDFDLSTDNPDMPSAWNNFLIWVLASNLAPEYATDIETQKVLDFKAREARADLFNMTVEPTTSIHNKGTFF